MPVFINSFSDTQEKVIDEAAAETPVTMQMNLMGDNSRESASPAISDQSSNNERDYDSVLSKFNITPWFWKCTDSLGFLFIICLVVRAFYITLSLCLNVQLHGFCCLCHMVCALCCVDRSKRE